MTDGGHVPSEGLPEHLLPETGIDPALGGGGWGADLGGQAGAPRPTYTFLDEPDQLTRTEHLDDEDDLLLMPGPQGSWGDAAVAGAAPPPAAGLSAPASFAGADGSMAFPSATPAAPVQVVPTPVPAVLDAVLPPAGTGAVVEPSAPTMTLITAPEAAEAPMVGTPVEPSWPPLLPSLAAVEPLAEAPVQPLAAEAVAAQLPAEPVTLPQAVPAPIAVPQPQAPVAQAAVPQPVAAQPARRPLHAGPPIPDPSLMTGQVPVRSLADRGPSGQTHTPPHGVAVPAAAPAPQAAPVVEVLEAVRIAVAETPAVPAPVEAAAPAPEPVEQAAEQAAQQPVEQHAEQPVEPAADAPSVAVPGDSAAAPQPVEAPAAQPEQVAAQVAEPVAAQVAPQPVEVVAAPVEAVPAEAAAPQPAQAPAVVEPAVAEPAVAEPAVVEQAPADLAPAEPKAVAAPQAVEAEPLAVQPVEPQAVPVQPVIPAQAAAPAQVAAPVQATAPAQAAAPVAAQPRRIAAFLAAPAPVGFPAAEPAVRPEPVPQPVPQPGPAVQPEPVAEQPPAARPEAAVITTATTAVAPDSETEAAVDANAVPPIAPAPVEPAEPAAEPQSAPETAAGTGVMPSGAVVAEPVAAPAAEVAAEPADPAAQEQGEEPPAPRPPAAPAYEDSMREAVHQVMRERRDIRNGFRPDPVPHEVLLRVLEAAHTAPSVGYSQPWDFVVIRSSETRRKMHELAARQREAFADSLPKGRAKQFREIKIEAILDTPVNIVVTADRTRGGRHTLGRHTQPQMAPYSAALAVENLWLAARAEGLGVGWVSFFDEEEMVRELGLPEHLDVVAYLCVGYVDSFPDEPELQQQGWAKKRPLSWVVHEEQYGNRALPGEEPHSVLAETLRTIRPLDAKALGEAWDRQKRMTKPAGSLGMLEIISAQLCGLSRKCPPPMPEPACVAIFAGDHGVHAQGVTPWPQEVTAQMVANFLAGGAVVNAFAAQVGAEVCVVDVGVASELPEAIQQGRTTGLLPRKVKAGTDDMTQGPAMSREEALKAIETGIETARDLVAAGNKILITGDMGIANTTASAALIAVFAGVDPAEVTGRGTGIDDETHAHKIDVIRRALALHSPDPTDPIGVLAAVGGLEHAALAGFLLGAASLRTPVILDGVIAGSAALAAKAIAPEVLAACIAGHRSAEPGHQAALAKLGLRPLIDLDLRLGEGTGALLALPLVQSAARAMHDVATFDSAGVTEKG